MSFLGDYKTQAEAEAEEAVIKYLQQPENQSGDIKMYQVRLNVISNILASNVVWNPNGTIEKRADSYSSHQ